MRWSTGSPTTSRASSSTRCSRRSSPARSRPGCRTRPPEAPEPLDGDPRGRRRARRCPTRPTGSTRRSSPTSPRPRRARASSGRCSPRRWGRTRCCGGPRRSAPSSRRVVVGWLRQALGLPDAFDGLLTDTASTSSLIALAAAREAAGLEAGGARARRPADSARSGLRVDRGAQLDREGVHDPRPRAGGPGQGPGRTSATRWTPPRSRGRSAPTGRPGVARRDRRHDRDHVLDLGRSGPPRSPTSRHGRGCGSTSTRRMRAPSRCCPSAAAPFAGWERADSIVVNPHKWLFTPLDASLLLTRRHGPPAATRSASCPSTCGRSTGPSPVRDYSEYQPQLGRRMRALKLWMQLRWFGLEGLRRRIACHLELAAWFAALDRRRSRLGAAGAGPVLHGVLPLPPAPPCRPRGRAARACGPGRRATSA